jgi:hypothetical protein
MKKISLLPLCAATGLLLSLASPASASVVLLDFNTLSGSGGPGGIWNVYAAPADINGGFLVDSTGTETPLTVSVAGRISDSSNFGPINVFNNTIPDSLPAWVTSVDNNGASGDYFFTNVSNDVVIDSFTLTIGGLTAGDTFSLDLLATRNEENTPGGLYEYSLNGVDWFGFRVLNSDGSIAMTDDWDTFNTQTQAFNIKSQGYNLHRYMNVNNITLTDSTLDIRVTDSRLEDSTINTSYSVLNAVQLTVVPEPSTLGLLGMGIGALLLRRRSRQA